MIIRSTWSHRARSLLEAGLPVAFSSDRPVAPGAPLGGIQAFVERITEDGNPYGPDECLTATSTRIYSAIYRHVALVGLRGVMVAVLGERDPGVVRDRAGVGNGKTEASCPASASAQPWCQARSRPTAMSAAPMTAPAAGIALAGLAFYPGSVR